MRIPFILSSNVKCYANKSLAEEEKYVWAEYASICDSISIVSNRLRQAVYFGLHTIEFFVSFQYVHRIL